MFVRHFSAISSAGSESRTQSSLRSLTHLSLGSHTNVLGNNTRAQLVSDRGYVILHYTVSTEASARFGKLHVMFKSMERLGQRWRTCVASTQARSSVDTSNAIASPGGSAGCGNPAGIIRGGLRPRMLRCICEYIDSHIEQRIKLEQLAKLSDLSVYHFARAFKQSVGLTPHQYLMRRRVERAIELIKSTNMRLSEIASTAGFADQSHCSRQFKQYVGMSPRAYRWRIG